MPHPLANFEIQKYYENEIRFNGFYSRDNLPKIKDGAYIINLDEHYDTGTHWIALWINNYNVTYFDSFVVEHIPKEIKTFINNKNIITNIFRIEVYHSIMCGYFCIGFINFMLAGKKLADYTNLFSPHGFKKNDSILKMHKIDKNKLSDQTKFRLHEIKKIENYLINEINETKSYSKQLNKYVTILNYIDKILKLLCATNGGVSIISFSSVIGAPAGIASASFTLIFSLATGIVKKLLGITRKKKKKHAKILMLSKSKFNGIDTLISQALIDMDRGHEEFITILKEKDRYEMMKENLKNKNGESYEIIRFNSVKSNT